MSNSFHARFLCSPLTPTCMHAKSLQSYPTLSDPMNFKLPDSFVHGILQARMWECVAIPSSRGSCWLRDWTHISHFSYIGRQVLYHCTTWELPQTPTVCLHSCPLSWWCYLTISSAASLFSFCLQSLQRTIRGIVL